MKKLLLSLAGVCLCLAGHSQGGERELPEKQVIAPYKVEVTFNKTSHILFPSAVKYVDLGSNNLIAGKADGSDNVVRIKAAVKGYEGETNFSVITDDGCFYSFTAVYSDNPEKLNIEIEDWLHKNPFSDFANDRMYIRLRELGNENPLTVSKIMHTIHERNRRDIKSIGSKHFGIELLLQGVYIHNDLLFLHTSIRNLSNISFHVDYVRFKIVDKKVTKRTAVQETFVEPVRVFNDVTQIGAKQTERNVFAFPKFTIPDGKLLMMEMYERNGGRHQSFSVGNSTLVNARFVNELKIE